MNLTEITKIWLLENRLDGLFNERLECCCDLNELFCCESGSDDCIGGVKKYIGCQEDLGYEIVKNED